MFLLAVSCIFKSYSQSGFSGDLMVNSNYYQRDSAIGATNTPLYDNLLFGGEGWLSLNYSNWGYDFGVRFDLFNNSALHDPQKAYSEQGIGACYVRKKIDELTITGGYFYDQFGNGITFRAYEDRALGIDYAMFGLKAEYQITKQWKIKGFTGRQKNLFSSFKPIVKGLNTDAVLKVNDDLQLIPGLSFVNRTLDQESMDLVVSAMPVVNPVVEERFVPKYNVYVYSFYNTLTYKKITWNIEYAGKSKDVYYDLKGKLSDKEGSVLYSNLGYATKGLGITVQFKRTENFSLRTSPNEILLKGVLDFLPPLSKQNSMRLLSRYVAATQVFSEMAYEADVFYTPVKGITLTANYSDIRDLNDVQLFREIYFDVEYKKKKKWRTVTGIQVLSYNQEVYQKKPAVPMVEAISPFAEWTLKLSTKKSIDVQLQYQFNGHDYGDWFYGQFEFNVAPHFSFALADMYNIVPKKTDDIHYYSIFTSYTKNANRFTVSYVKQVEGIVCTGGVCRYEPAFSGVKFTLTSSF